jgi:hypothetical protein
MRSLPVAVAWQGMSACASSSSPNIGSSGKTLPYPGDNLADMTELSDTITYYPGTLNIDKLVLQRGLL